MNEYGGITWNDLVRKYFPDASNKMVEYILWEKTMFPMASPEYIEKQLHDFSIDMYAERRSNKIWPEEKIIYI